MNVNTEKNWINKYHTIIVKTEAIVPGAYGARPMPNKVLNILVNVFIVKWQQAK